MSKKQEKGPNQNSNIQKDDILQAVVITDSFNKNFMPACSCLATLPVVNMKLIDYALEALNISGVDEVILLCSSNVNEIKEHINSRPYLGIDVRIFLTEDCCSFGDVMRALDRYVVIRSTFILFTIDIINNLKFKTYVEKFKKIQEKDKGISMMLLCKGIGTNRKDLNNKTVLVGSPEKRVIWYQVDDSKTVDIPLKVLLEHDCVDVKNNILVPGMAVCSVAVPPLFSDNFDFQTLDDFIRGLLINEEILQGTIYYTEVEKDGYLGKVTDWPRYQIVSRDIVHRWVYPLVLDLTKKYSYSKNNTYLKNVTFCDNCELEMDVVIGNQTKLNKNVNINNSVIGDNCIIGENVRISDSYIFDNVVIGNNCTIEYAVIGEKCEIKENSIVEKNCILSPNIVLKNNTKIKNVSLIFKETNGASDNYVFYKKSQSDGSDSEEEEICGLVTEKYIPELVVDDDTSSESSEDSPIASPVAMDDVKIFYTEVIDSLTRGYEDKLKCENLILEINSSRYAYNVTVNEVNFNLICAILNIPIQNAKEVNPKQLLQHSISKLNYFMPILKNYIKNKNAQQDCLAAVEDVISKDGNLLSIIPKILHFLYENDILNENEILSWFSKSTSDDLKKVLTPFIKWLNEADEETDESSD